MAGAGKTYQGTIDNSRIESVYVNIFEVSASQREFVISFGEVGTLDAGGGAATARLTNRVVLTPSHVKRIASLLSDTIDRYESAFGVLTEEVQSGADLDDNRESIPFSCASERSAEIAGSLVALVDSLGVEYGMERSFKISENSLLTNRFIMGFKKSDLPGAPDDTIIQAFTQMGMPPRFLEECRGLLSETGFIHFGFEEHGAGCLLKAYLEFNVRLKVGAGGGRVAQEPFLVFLGFKWDPDDAAVSAVSRYTCYPLLTPDEIRERLLVLFERNPEYRSFAAAGDILQKAVKIISNDRIIYEEVSEENNPRKSFDMNLYGANLRIRDIYTVLMDIGRAYSLDAGAFTALCDAIRGRRFGHLSGGIDRHGKDFLTVYYGAETVAGGRRAGGAASGS